MKRLCIPHLAIMPWGLHKIAKVLRSSDVFHNAVNSVVREWNYEIGYLSSVSFARENALSSSLVTALKAVI